MSQGFNAKKILAMQDISTEELEKAAKGRRELRFINKIFTIIILIVAALLLVFGDYLGYNLEIVGYIGIGRFLAKQANLKGYINGYTDGFSKGAENTQRQLGVDVDLAQEMDYDSA